MSAISAVIGGLLAARDGVFDAPLLILVALGLVLAHTGSNLVNDYWDYQHGIDTPDSPRANYSPHPLVSEGNYFRQFVAVTLLILAAATAIGVYLVVAAGPGVLIFALTGAALLMFYSGGPFPLKYIGLGEIAVFFIWGPLMIGGTYYVMAEELPTWVLLASAPYGLGVTSVLFGKHLDKLDFDKSKGIRTMPIVLGESLARRVTMVICVLMYVSAAALAVWQEMWALVLVVGALPLLPPFADDRVEVAGEILGVGLGAQHLGTARYHRQRVVHLMPGAGGEFREGSELGVVEINRHTRHVIGFVPFEDEIVGIDFGLKPVKTFGDVRYVDPLSVEFFLVKVGPADADSLNLAIAC